jgi:hypothetical protein
MNTLFEMTPTNEDIFNMTVPLGEACGCYDNRGCMDSMYCSCECEACLIQRLVDANEICHACRSRTVAECVACETENGDDEFRFVCTHCADIYHENIPDVDSDDESVGSYAEGELLEEGEIVGDRSHEDDESVSSLNSFERERRERYALFA